MNDFIPVSEPVIGPREKELVLECLNTGWISSEGPFVSQFEEVFSRRVGRHYGIACANGSAALDIAVAALNLGPGDEVILPTFTIISCAAAIVRAGATPVVVDADPDTWNMVPEQVAAAITPRTAAIMVVHIYGLPVDMDPILALAERHGLAIIEDAAELIGGSYKGKPCGSFGTISTFSFYSNKHVTTGEGGMVVTDDPALADRCRMFRNLCFQPKQRFVHEELGWNYRMTNLQAALGIAQIERLDHTIKLKSSMGAQYTSLFKDLSALKLPVIKTTFADNSYWVYGILVSSDLGNIDSAYFQGHLLNLGIGTRPFFAPMHLQPVFKSLGLFQSIELPTSELLYKRGFYIPSSVGITTDQINRVARAIISILNNL
jgi:perosamine synthetase